MDEASEKQKHDINWRIVVLVITGVILILVAAGGALWWSVRSTNPLPDNVANGVSFQLYYPSILPKGYKLLDKSAHIQNDIVFFILNNGDKQVSVSEQAAPQQPPDFKSIENFNTSFRELDTAAGKSIVGVDVESHKPVGILVTNTTLINISAGPNVPQDIVVKLTQDMSSLAQ